MPNLAEKMVPPGAPSGPDGTTAAGLAPPPGTLESTTPCRVGRLSPPPIARALGASPVELAGNVAGVRSSSSPPGGEEDDRAPMTGSIGRPSPRTIWRGHRPQDTLRISSPRLAEVGYWMAIPVVAHNLIGSRGDCGVWAPESHAGRAPPTIRSPCETRGSGWWAV